MAWPSVRPLTTMSGPSTQRTALSGRQNTMRPWSAPVFADGKKRDTLRGADIAEQFKAIVDDYVART
jgi:hypothetical protein